VTKKRELTTEYSRVIRIETVRTCPIIVGANLIDDLGECFDFSGYSSIVLITDARVNKLYGQSVTAALQTTGKRISALTLPVGERTKSLRMAERGYRFLLEAAGKEYEVHTDDTGKSVVICQPAAGGLDNP